MPVLRTQAPRLLNRGQVFHLRGGGTVSSVVTSEMLSGASVAKQAWRSQQKAEKATAPSPPVRYAGIAHPSPALTEPGLGVLLREWRGGVLRSDIRVPEAKRGRVPCRNKEDAPQGTEKLNTKALSSKAKGFICARYWDRTSDLFRVREARYRCANRAHKTVVLLRGEDGIRTRVHGFAGRCLTTRPPHRIRSTRERVRTLGVLTSG